MKKITYLFALIFHKKVKLSAVLLLGIGLTVLHAQNYRISFTGSGMSNRVSNVTVENLTRKMSNYLTYLNGWDILRLTVVTDVNSIKDYQPELKIYPNPTHDNSILEIIPPIAGNAIITVYDMSGKALAKTQSYLENIKQSFRLSGINNGFYIINVKGNNYQFSEKLLSTGKSDATINIEKLNNIQLSDKNFDEKIERSNKGILETIMEYSIGDRLKFTGYSDNNSAYITLVTDIPSSDKTINFNFIACTDVEYNNYPVVEIGTQVWMAENLRTTRYNNGDLIGTTNPPSLNIMSENNPKYQWSAVYQGSPYKLYTYYAATDSRNVCPVGWHIPNDTEWKTLEMYIGMTQLHANATGFRGTDQGTQLKSANWWGSDSQDHGTNTVGFTALENGMRNASGTFNGVGTEGWWWTSTNTDQISAYYKRIMYTINGIERMEGYGKNGLSIRCLLGEPLPIITTTTVTSITPNEAVSGGNVISDGSSPITERGVCWNTTSNPLKTNSHTSIGNGLGIFSSNLRGLTPNTQYYVRAYATNNAGTVYGNQVIFHTEITDLITDIDGNSYKTVKIGTQVWMAENLKTTKYNNGDIIGTTTPSTKDIISESTPKYQWAWNGIESNVTAYGRLYTGYSVNDSRKLCPDSWDMPTQDDWTTLTDYLGGLSVSGGKLKEAGFIHWLSPNTGATNETKFTAPGGGYRFGNGGFGGLNSDGIWWSSTTNKDNINELWTIGMGNTYTEAYGTNNSSQKSGYSVRCIKNTKITDVDGNSYKTVKIGTQVWMAENLKTTRYNNSDLIGTTIPATLIIYNEDTPKYQWAYDGNESNVNTYGRLYTWFAATDKRNLCPTGWHVSSEMEYETLITYFQNNGYTYPYQKFYPGNVGKSFASTSGWTKSSIEGTVGNDQTSNNRSGFSGLPAGIRTNNQSTGVFSYIGDRCYWLTTSSYGPFDPEIWILQYDRSSILLSINEFQEDGFSVRCVKN